MVLSGNERGKHFGGIEFQIVKFQGYLKGIHTAFTDIYREFTLFDTNSIKFFK